MRETGDAQVLVDCFGNTSPYASDKRGRDLAGRPGDHGSDLVRYCHSKPLNALRQALRRRRSRRPLRANRIAQEKADRAKSVKIALKGKVVAARPHRAGGRHQPDHASDNLAGQQLVRHLARSYANPLRRVTKFWPRCRQDIQRQPRSSAFLKFNQRYAACDLRCDWRAKDRRRFPLRFEFRQSAPHQQREHGETGKMPNMAPTQEPRQYPHEQ
nr:hypothetical protein [Tianweitania aestuarii]